MEKEVIYYSDELNDEFSGTYTVPRVIDEKYNYSKNPVWDFCSFIVQNFISMPIKIIYAKAKFNLKFVGKDKLKKCKKQGYFIYANHTQNFLDTFLPSLAVYPKRNFLIVNPENISVKGTGWFVEMLGAIPIPNTKNATKNFLKQIEKRVNKKSSITIYPEAHIWPYYTKIRDFKAVSFKYPVKLNKPCFAITNTYQVKNKKIQMVSYIDGPFYPDNTLKEKEACQKLRDEIFECMTYKSKNSNVEKIKYIKKS
ncbi:MAG: 1-acyl-sn-glycerol-3-phosphate acyltransferase [Clostridia bacterium]|nr:1-acyl-sn-glycerol-3-phosphate acyltransferase [Clostridia bacterium]